MTPSLYYTYTVFIQDMIIPFMIGVYDHEKEKPNNVRISVKVTLKTPDPIMPDNLDEVICYDDLSQRIHMLTQQGHVQLIETLARQIGDICLSYPKAESAWVYVEKTGLRQGDERVGIELMVSHTDLSHQTERSDEFSSTPKFKTIRS